MRRYTSRRKKALRNLAIVTIIFAIGFLATKLFSLKSKQDDVIVAKIGKEKIYKSEIEKKLKSIFADEQQLIAVPALETLPKEVIEIVVKEIYSDREILKLAKKQGFEKNADIQEKIINFQEKTLRQAYIDAIIEKEVTKEKVSEKYAEITNSLSGKKEYQIAHILIKSKEDADKIIAELTSKKAPKFSDLARRYSLEQQSAQNGGDLGFILEDNITKEIADELINLKKDETSSPIKTKLGWHIVKLLDSRDAKTISFEESKEKIREQLIQNRINELNSTFTNNNEVKFFMNFEKDQNQKVETEKKMNSENKDEIKNDNTTVNEGETNKEKPSETDSEVKNTAINPAQEGNNSKEKNPEKTSEEKTSNNKNNSKLLPQDSKEKPSTDSNIPENKSDKSVNNAIDNKAENKSETKADKNKEKKSSDKNSSKSKDDKKNDGIKSDNSKGSKAKNNEDKAKNKNN